MIKILMQILFFCVFCDGAFCQSLSDDFKNAINEKDVNKKIKIYDSIISKDPNAVSAYFNRGLIYFNLHDWTEAKLDFKKFINLTHKNRAKALNNLAICAINLEAYEEAIKYWDEALILNPESKLYLGNKIKTLIKLKKTREALNILNKKIKTNGFSEYYLLRAKVFELTGDHESELADLNAYIKNVSASLQVYYRRASIYLNLKQYLKAKIDLDLLSEKKYKDSLYKLSVVEFYLKNYKSGISKLNEWLKLNPDDLQALKVGIEMFLSIHKYNDAHNLLNKIIELDETDWDNFYKRGMILFNKGNLKESLKDLNTFLAAKPESVNALIQRAKIYELMNKNELVIKDLLKASKHANDYETKKTLAVFYINNKQFEKAISILTQTLKNNFDDYEIFFLRGLCFLENNEIGAAIFDFSEVLKRFPEHEKALYNRANLYMILKKYENAAVDYNILIGISESNVEYQLKYALCEYYLGNEKLSRTSYEKAKELDESLPDYEYYFSDFNLYS